MMTRRTVGRRAIGVFPAMILAVAFPAAAQHVHEPASVSRAEAGPAGLWKLRSCHLVWGMPRQTDNRHNITYPGETEPRPGMTVLVREGFVLGHYDLYRVPAWVAMRWTRDDRHRLGADTHARSFRMDLELPLYARGGTEYDRDATSMERGHMARHEDNEAWGEDNSDAGCLMSNIVPQHMDMNGEAWNDLENLHQGVVANGAIDTVWIISGPIFENDRPESTVANGVAVPRATYKIIGWFGSDGEFNARGYVVRQEDRIRDDPGHYLTRIRDIEQATGLDFFPELPESRATAIETALPSNLWDDIDSPRIGDAVIRIDTLLPDPEGDESIHEAVSVRNVGTATVLLNGWLLQDESGRTWELSGSIDAGDEMTFTRNGQSMALNNGGDTVRLLRPDRSVADSVTYSHVVEGQVLRADDLR